MNKKLVTLAFVLTIFVGLVIAFNPVSGVNPFKQKTVAVKTTTEWDAAIENYQVKMIQKSSPGAIPTQDELIQAKKDLEEVNQ